VSLDQCTGGGVLELSATPLTLSHTKGDLEVDTDADLGFTQHEGRLKVVGYGAAVRGTGSNGTLEIETDGAEVRLEQCAGTTTVRGRELDLNVFNPTGEVAVQVVSSRVSVKKAGGPLRLANEFGDIEVAESTHPVEVTIRDGNARLVGLKSSVKLDADGGDEIEVGWVSFSGQEDSLIRSGSGDLTVRLPSGANLRVEAQAPDGQIESGLQAIVVAEDGHSASGTLGATRAGTQTPRPTIRVHGGGDIHLDSPGRE
jgi:hypothetical protein